VTAAAVVVAILLAFTPALGEDPALPHRSHGAWSLHRCPRNRHRGRGLTTHGTVAVFVREQVEMPDGMLVRGRRRFKRTDFRQTLSGLVGT